MGTDTSAFSTQDSNSALGYSTVWIESFDIGLGQVNHTWGHVWVHDGMATVSSWAGEGWQQSGMMQPPSGAAANQGFGLYSVTMVINSYAPGAFACLWPGTDVWPGPELDFIELDFNGNPYSTIHWKGAGNTDEYQTYAITGIDPRQVHTYSLEWASDHLSMYVDGKLNWTTTEHVPQDAAHGGQNEAFGVGEQPGWAAGYQNGDNSVDVYEMSYAVKSAGGTSTPTPPVTPEPAPPPPAEPAPPPTAELVPPPTPAPVSTPTPTTNPIQKLTSGADEVVVTPGMVIEGFQAGLDKLVLPAGTNLASVHVSADHDWVHGGDAWGQRVAYDGGDVFLRYSWAFDAQRDTASGATTPTTPTTTPTPTPTAPPATGDVGADGIVYLTSAADRVVAAAGLVVEDFQAGTDKLLIPAGTNLASVHVSADHDWVHGGDAWGQRVAYDGGDVFLRYSWAFDEHRDIAVAASSDLVFA